MSSKMQLRQQLSQQLDSMSPDDRANRSDQMFDRLIGVPEVREAAMIFCFVSHRNEIDTHRLIRHWLDEGKQVAVPYIVGHGIMHAHCLTTFEELTPGEMGILMPPQLDPVDRTPDVTCCPGLGFCMRGNRLGVGGGYYDRFLSIHPTTCAIGLCYDTQICGDIPADGTDRPVHRVVTDQRVIECPPRK